MPQAKRIVSSLWPFPSDAMIVDSVLVDSKREKWKMVGRGPGIEE